MSHFDDLMAGPPPTHLPEDPAAAALAAAPSPRRRTPPPGVAGRLGRARPAGRATGADDVTVYAYARVGYHRSLDMLRRNGWKGHGPVPWEHEPNRGFLRCLALLALAARAIGETDEWERCSEFLRDSSPAAYDGCSPSTLTRRLKDGQRVSRRAASGPSRRRARRRGWAGAGRARRRRAGRRAGGRTASGRP